MQISKGIFYIKKYGSDVLFFLILLLLLMCCSHFLEQAQLKDESIVQGRNKSVFRIMREPEQTLDVVVVGDSLSYSSISPYEWWNSYGFTSYVCGQPGQRIQESYYMLEHAFRSQSPKVVLLEANALFRGKGGMSDVVQGIESWGYERFGIFRGHDIWKGLVLGKTYHQDNYKGFAIRCSIKPYTKGEYMVQSDKKKEITSYTNSYVKRIMELCEKNGATLILFSAPSPKNYSYAKHNGAEAFAKENKIPYVDLNLLQSELGMNWTEDTADQGDHLNYLGAKKVTDYMGGFIKEICSLPDHRGDLAYKEWIDGALEYDKILVSRKEKIQKTLDNLE